MALKTTEMTWTGTAPLMQHNVRLADGLDLITRAMKQITAKGKNKTDDDAAELVRLEWAGGLYHPDAEAFAFKQKLNGGRPYMKAEHLLGAMREGACRRKKGKDVGRGMRIITPTVPLVYAGPTGIREMWDCGRFRDYRAVKPQGRGTVMRTRPIFNQWQLTFELHYDDTVWSPDQIVSTAVDAGALCGLGDYRPQFGRFEVEA